jgi:CelD/BcsL family acetyltransferase involved in cellulose biosynthesis
LSPSFKSAVHRHPDDLETLRIEWENLFARDPRASVYQAWLPQVRHWQMRQDGSTPRVITVRDDSGLLVGLLPGAAVNRRRGPFSGSIIRPLAQQTWPDFSALIDPIVGAPQVMAELLGTLAGELSRKDRLDLRFIRPDSWLGQGELDALSLHRQPTAVTTSRMVYPAGATDWGAQVSRNTRYTVKLQQRRLVADHGAVIEAVKDCEAVLHWCVPYQEMHSLRSRETQRTVVFGIGNSAGGFPLMLSEMITAQMAEFHIIRIGSRLIAGQVTFHDAKLSHDYRRTFDVELAAYGPGHILHAAAVQRSLDRGDLGFDLGLGSDSYKAKWSNQVEPTARLTGLFPGGKLATAGRLIRKGWGRSK